MGTRRALRILLTAMAFLVASGAIARAQKPEEVKLPTILPGSSWTALGNISPTERGNLIDSSYFEQGVTAYRSKSLSLVPYVSSVWTVDSKGYDWNNRQTAQFGAKLVKNLGGAGIVSLGAAYSREYRWKSGMSASAPIGYASYWFGWNTPSANRSSKKVRFPGSSWGIVGNISPVEKGNVLAALYIQQGVAIAKINRVSLVPFGESTLSTDSKGKDWNNRAICGGGLKFVVPASSKVVELGASYLREDRFKSGLVANGFSIFIKLWFGWNPKLLN